MKTYSKFFAGFASGILFCAAAQAAPNAAMGPAAEPPKAVDPASAAQINRAAAADGEPAASPAEYADGQGLRFNFRGVPLEQVLSYLSKAAGFVIHPMVNISGQVDAWSDQPLTKDEALQVLERILGDKGYNLIRDGRVLTIVSSADSRQKSIPVMKFVGVDKIPRNSEAATYIIPVRNLNSAALLKNLQPLIARDLDLQANESANALLVTGAQSDIRRVAEILTKLDSVSSSINSLEVIPMKYGDAKAVADLVKELFPSQGASGSGQNSTGGNAARFGNGGGGRGGGGNQFGGGFPGDFGGGNNGGADSGQTPGSRISAVADEHSNALIVSAPEDLIPTIRELVQKLDQPVEDVVQMKVFHFKHADPTEMANLLANLFPDATDTSDNSGARMQFGGQGGPQGMMATTAGGSGSGQSVYMKKTSKVTAVPDPRTLSLLVSASKSLMPQIEEMVKQLDEIDANAMKVRVYTLNNAEVQDVQEVLQGLYSMNSTSSGSSSQANNPLQTRAQTVGNNMTSSGVGSGTTSSAGSSSSGGSRTGQ